MGSETTLTVRATRAVRLVGVLLWAINLGVSLARELNPKGDTEPQQGGTGRFEVGGFRRSPADGAIWDEGAPEPISGTLVVDRYGATWGRPSGQPPGRHWFSLTGVRDKFVWVDLLAQCGPVFELKEK